MDTQAEDLLEIKCSLQVNKKENLPLFTNTYNKGWKQETPQNIVYKENH
jgi:hypothetical protein